MASPNDLQSQSPLIVAPHYTAATFTPHGHPSSPLKMSPHGYTSHQVLTMGFCLLPQQAFNTTAVVHHMRKLHMNIHAAAESSVPDTQASEASRPSTPIAATQPATPDKDKITSVPPVPTGVPPTQLEQDTKMREESFKATWRMEPPSKPTSSSLVLSDNHSPPTRTSCGCGSACMGNKKTKTSFCSERG